MKKLINIFLVLEVCIYPSIFIYTQNVYESEFSDTLLVSAIYILSSLLICGLLRIIIRDWNIIICLTNIIMLLLLNFELFVVWININYKYIIMTIICIIMVSIIAFLLVKGKIPAKDINRIFLIVFSTLILFNIVIALPKIINKYWIISNTEEGNNQYPNIVLNMKKSNIYYIILDEYSGLQNLRNYYGYDNQKFYNELSLRNFNVSSESRNEEGYSTVVLVPNLLNLDYVAKEGMTETECLQLIEKPYLFRLLQSWGYSINTCSYPSFLDNSMSDRSFEELEDFQEKAGYYCLKNSVYIQVYNWMYKQKLEREDGRSYGEQMQHAFNYYTSLFSDSNLHEKPCLYMGYFQTPHAPFFYNSDGSLNNPEEYYNWVDQTNYLGSLEWTNNIILESIDKIIESDENAIIIIQSDHGARFTRHMWEIGEGNEDDDTYYEHDIINCVYFHGDELEIEGLSGINTIRKVLNEEFGTDFNMIDSYIF